MLTQATVTIANGESLSPALMFGQDFWPVRMSVDAAWDTNVITFQGSYDGTNFFDIDNPEDNSEYQLPSTAASKSHNLKYQNFAGFKALKVRSGTAASPVNQNGATTVTFTLLYVG